MTNQHRVTSVAAHILASLLIGLASLCARAEDPHVENLPPIDTASDAVGATPGEFNVDSSGAATYTMPIFTAPAPGGVAPQLALSYSSRGGHGALGVGFGISGTSSIERCRKTKEHGDGAGPFGAVDFSANDVFCLDGQRLVKLTTTNCPTIAGAPVVGEFRTELESFARICAYQGDSITNGPSRFTVERRDGSIAQYGFTADSRVEPNLLGVAQTNVVMRWALDRTRQPTGAYIDYEYFESGPAGEHRLTKVKFAGRVNPSSPYSGDISAPVSYVSFIYENIGQGQRIDYLAGSMSTLAKRLKTVSSYGPVDGSGSQTAKLLRDYTLTYDDASGAMLPRIADIEECATSYADVVGGTRVCRPKTVFAWNLPESDFTLANSSGNVEHEFYRAGNSKLGDFNGDGVTDQVSWENACNPSEEDGGIRGGVGVAIPQLISGKIMLNKPQSFATDNAATLVEVPNQIQVFKYKYLHANGCYAGDSAEGRFHVYDFNGDGLDDLMVDVHNVGFVIFHSQVVNGAYSLSSAVSSLTDGSNLATRFSSVLADMTGDGLPDLLTQTSAATGGLEFRRMGTVGKGAAQRYAFNASGVLPVVVMDGTTVLGGIAKLIDRLGSTLAVGDIDADGRADQVLSLTVGEVTQHFLFRTSGEENVAGTTSMVLRRENFTIPATAMVSLRLQDVNGDGLQDAVAFYGGPNMPASISLWRNRGSAANRFGAQEDVSLGATTSFYPLMDFNFDGIADLVYRADCPLEQPDCLDRALKLRLGRANGFDSAQSIGTVTLKQGKPQPVACGAESCAAVEGQTFVDVNGDGVQELIHYASAHPVSGGHLVRFYRYNQNGRTYDVDTIKSITNGLGAKVSVEYAPLTHSSNYKRHTGAPLISNGSGSPTFDTFSPMAVVKSVKRSMPIPTDNTSMHETRYLYRGARVQAGGRGFLGFERRTEVDVASKIATTTKFRQDFPFVGQPAATLVELLTTLPNTPNPCENGPEGAGCLAYTKGLDSDALALSGLGGKKLREVTHVHDKRSSGSVHFPYVTSTTETAYAINGTTKLSLIADTWTFSNDTLGNTEGNPVTTACNTGSCGNLRTHTKNWKRYEGTTESLDLVETTIHTYGGIENVTGEGNFTGVGETSRWQLGLIGQTTVNRARAAASSFPASDNVTRTEQFGYDDRGLLNETITEPNGSTSLFMRSVLTRDDWGNVTEMVRCSNHFLKESCSGKVGFVQRQWPEDKSKFMRYTKTEFSTDRRFVKSEFLPYFDGSGTSVGVDLATFSIQDGHHNALGQPTVRTEANGVIRKFRYGSFGQQQFQSDNTGGFQYSRVRTCTASICPPNAAYRVETSSTSMNAGVTATIAPTNFAFFDLLGREMVRTTRLIVTNEENSQWSSVATEYDDRGRVKRVSVPYFSDAAGAVQATNVSCNNLDAACWESKEYDDFDRAKSITKPDLGSGTVVTTITYDATARQVTQVTPVNAIDSITHTTYNNSLGEATKVQESNLKDSTLKYAAFGELAHISKTEKLANRATNTTITLSATFDVRGRKVASSDPDKGDTTHQYNALGELIHTQDALANEESRFYDALGRVYRRLEHARLDEGNVFVDRNILNHYDKKPNDPLAAGMPPPPELIVNGEFASTLASWTSATAVWSSNTGNSNSGAALIYNTGHVQQVVPVNAALQYELKFWHKVPTPFTSWNSSAKAELLVEHLDNAGVAVQAELVTIVNGSPVSNSAGNSTSTITPHPASKQLRIRFRVTGMPGLNLLVDSVSVRATSPYPRNPVSSWTIAGGAGGIEPGKLLIEEDATISFRREYDYDNFGRQIADSTYQIASGRWHPTARDYDAFGRLSKRYDADRRLYDPLVNAPDLEDGVEYLYDGHGYLIEERDLRTDTRLRTLKSQTARAQPAIEQLSNYSAGTAFKVMRGFDERTGLQMSQTAQLDTTMVQDLDYSYDKLGNVTERLNRIDGKREVFAYDVLNRLSSVRMTNDVSNPVPTGLVDTMAFTYDPFGNVATKQVGASSQTYDYCVGSACQQPHAVKSLTTTAEGTSSYTYDVTGNQRLMTRDRIQGSTTYRQRRHIMYHWMGKATYVSSYGLTITGGVTSVDPNVVDATQLYDYGPSGEMVWRSSSTLRNGGVVPMIAKDSGGNPQGRHAVPADHGRHLALAVGHDKDYLNAVNAMIDSDIQRPLKYAALRRLPVDQNKSKSLAKVACPSSAPPEVPLNDVVAEIFGNVELIYGTGDCDTARRRTGSGVIIEQRKNSDRYGYEEIDWDTNTTTIYTYQLTDPLGSVDVQVRLAGNSTYSPNTTAASRNPRRVSFDAHGQQRFATNVDNNGDGDFVDAGEGTTWANMTEADRRLTRVEGTAQGYAGHQNYNSVGIVHMKGRIYDPTLGRFLQPDPIVEDDLNPQTWNRYTYVRNNPMTFTDPTGYTTHKENFEAKTAKFDEGMATIYGQMTAGSQPGSTPLLTRTKAQATPAGATSGSTSNSSRPGGDRPSAARAEQSSSKSVPTTKQDVRGDNVEANPRYGRKVAAEEGGTRYLNFGKKKLSHDPAVPRAVAEEYARKASEGWQTVTSLPDGTLQVTWFELQVSEESSRPRGDAHLVPCVPTVCTTGFGAAEWKGQRIWVSSTEKPDTPVHEFGHIFGFENNRADGSNSIMGGDRVRWLTPDDFNLLYDAYEKVKR